MASRAEYGPSRVKPSASYVRHLSQVHVLVSSRILTNTPKPPFLPDNDQPNTNPSRQHREPSLLACRGWHQHTWQSQGPGLARKPRWNAIYWGRHPGCAQSSSSILWHPDATEHPSPNGDQHPPPFHLHRTSRVQRWRR